MVTREKPVIGWREGIALPQLGIEQIKAKIDTGARSSALHAYDVQVFRDNGVEMVRFKVHPIQRDTESEIVAEAPLADQRWVKSSHGRETLRPMIETEVVMMGQRWPIELTLVNRDAMGFRMLLGRQALRGRFAIDPGRSYLAGPGPKRKRKKKRSPQRGAATS